mmetsp:Transcript_61261/g.162849  ORF Transcript_61261/g.162849 Transcript_61261/m.162849 type:complete len:242 (+) Transcript_61261:206-931(+)
MATPRPPHSRSTRSLPCSSARPPPWAPTSAPATAPTRTTSSWAPPCSPTARTTASGGCSLATTTPLSTSRRSSRPWRSSTRRIPITSAFPSSGSAATTRRGRPATRQRCRAAPSSGLMTDFGSGPSTLPLTSRTSTKIATRCRSATTVGSSGPRVATASSSVRASSTALRPRTGSSAWTASSRSAATCASHCASPCLVTAWRSWRRARLASSASTSWTWASPASTSPSTPRAASVATWCRR